MKLDDTVMVQFFGELIESYRQQIMDQEEARELSKKEKKFLADLRKELELSNPQAYRMVTELFGCMLDISQIKQEQLKELGWRVIVIWECELKKNFQGTMNRLEQQLVNVN